MLFRSVKLLHVLAMVALVARQPEDALLEDGIALVPQRQREADVLPAIGNAGQAVLVPAVDTRAGVVVRKKSPRQFRRGCSLRAPCPRRARSGRGPSVSSG